MAESSASVLARHADSVRSGSGASADGIEIEPGRPSPPRVEANPAAAGRAGGKQPRKQRRLPREMRGLLAGEAGVASSDSEDEVDHLVASLQRQRLKVARYKMMLFVCVALVVGLAVGGGIAASFMTDDDDDDDDHYEEVHSMQGWNTRDEATRHCATARRPEHQAAVDRCETFGGF